MSPWPESRLAGPALTLPRRVTPGITRCCRHVLRRHWPLLIVLGCAAVLRAVVLREWNQDEVMDQHRRDEQH